MWCLIHYWHTLLLTSFLSTKRNATSFCHLCVAEYEKCGVWTMLAAAVEMHGVPLHLYTLHATKLPLTVLRHMQIMNTSHSHWSCSLHGCAYQTVIINPKTGIPSKGRCTRILDYCTLNCCDMTLWPFYTYIISYIGVVRQVSSTSPQLHSTCKRKYHPQTALLRVSVRGAVISQLHSC